ncbi:MAG: hypothetical protein J6U28_08735 [Bacteroidales bacterium]|nr:hypothetical protein [Bacteroidales bacterium]
MLDITMRNLAKVINGRKFRKITIMKPVEYYDKVSIDRDVKEFYVGEQAWDIIKAQYIGKYEAFGYSRTMEVDDDNLIIFVDLEKKDEEKAKKK